ncbi:MAG: hypothetical protein FK734_14460 [Asgard group archaeon]|nr:hypothetical protein [Asgard group archaeon]
MVDSEFDSRLLIGKIAADKDNKKLGKIVRVELMLGKTVKKEMPFVFILVSKIFKKDIIVPIEAEKVFKYSTYYAWFDITKEEFDKEVKTLEKVRTEREIYTGDTGFHKVKGNLGFAFDPYRLSHKSKERKK